MATRSMSTCWTGMDMCVPSASLTMAECISGVPMSRPSTFLVVKQSTVATMDTVCLLQLKCCVAHIYVYRPRCITAQSHTHQRIPAYCLAHHDMQKFQQIYIRSLWIDSNTAHWSRDSINIALGGLWVCRACQEGFVRLSRANGVRPCMP